MVEKPFDKDLFHPKSHISILLHGIKTNLTLSNPVCLNIVLAESGKAPVVRSFRDAKSIIMVFSYLIRLPKHYIEAYYRILYVLGDLKL